MSIMKLIDLLTQNNIDYRLSGLTAASFLVNSSVDSSNKKLYIFVNKEDIDTLKDILASESFSVHDNRNGKNNYQNASGEILGKYPLTASFGDFEICITPFSLDDDNNLYIEQSFIKDEKRYVVGKVYPEDFANRILDSSKIYVDGRNVPTLSPEFIALEGINSNDTEKLKAARMVLPSCKKENIEIYKKYTNDFENSSGQPSNFENNQINNMFEDSANSSSQLVQNNTQGKVLQLSNKNAGYSSSLLIIFIILAIIVILLLGFVLLQF